MFLAVFTAAGEWDKALRHVAPLAAFFTGVFLAQVLRLPGMRWRLRSAALARLGLEILFLIAGSLLPPSFPDLVLVPGIALVAAMQNSSFDRLESWSYNSVMTTNNLRRFAEGLFTAALRGGDPAAVRQARLFGIICLCFLAGAIVGAFSTARLHNTPLWVPVALLGGTVGLWLRLSRQTKPSKTETPTRL
jgi:uncharacterized membrane protein YoaK (UPF0700 family)